MKPLIAFMLMKADAAYRAANLAKLLFLPESVLDRVVADNARRSVRAKRYPRTPSKLGRRLRRKVELGRMGAF